MGDKIQEIKLLNHLEKLSKQGYFYDHIFYQKTLQRGVVSHSFRASSKEWSFLKGLCNVNIVNIEISYIYHS